MSAHTGRLEAGPSRPTHDRRRTARRYARPGRSVVGLCAPHTGRIVHHGRTALGLSVRGWARALVDAGVHSYEATRPRPLGEVTVVVLVALLGLLTVAGLSALRLRGPIELVYLLLAALAACLAPIATTLPRERLRNTAVLSRARSLRDCVTRSGSPMASRPQQTRLAVPSEGKRRRVDHRPAMTATRSAELDARDEQRRRSHFTKG